MLLKGRSQICSPPIVSHQKQGQQKHLTRVNRSVLEAEHPAHRSQIPLCLKAESQYSLVSLESKKFNPSLFVSPLFLPPSLPSSKNSTWESFNRTELTLSSEQTQTPKWMSITDDAGSVRRWVCVQDTCLAYMPLFITLFPLTFSHNPAPFSTLSLSIPYLPQPLPHLNLLSFSCFNIEVDLFVYRLAAMAISYTINPIQTPYKHQAATISFRS